MDISTWSTGKKVGIIGGGSVVILIALFFIIKKASAKTVDKAKGDDKGGKGGSTGGGSTATGGGTAPSSGGGQTLPAGNQVNTNGLAISTPAGQPLTDPKSNQPDKGIAIPNGRPDINGGFSDALQIYNAYMAVGGSQAQPDANGYMPWQSGGVIWSGADSDANYKAAQQQLQSIGILDGLGNPD